MIKVIGIIICLLLVVMVGWLSLSADHTMYLVYLMIASLLGVATGLIKNWGR
ncbi:MAG: hypothetical protein HC837_13875 [Chloroflexaceae bacterium]|nr:hypothetical protein [Chloroflexaceae bacterium]